ncbi:hypothetical protein AARAC_003424 [Aspergillus arachidicola]|uniref:Uncharacterized protein n=1 Tax=Aspergillus arachidicola TaxID=656916 RepID=A0A2G7GCA1_9EURO|nr:hypothetical protein AARAC_003424 [Aspergillus arachidicola]
MLYDFITSVAKEKGLSAYIAKYLERPDLGFSFFYAYTRKDTRVLVPPTRVGQAIYLASESAKLRYLARLFEKEGLSDGDSGRWLVFAHWPLVMWMTEMFLDALSIPYVVIRSQMTADQRNEAVAAFTASISPYKVLLTTYTCGAFGQTKEKQVWILFGDHTISRFIEYNMHKKVLPEIAAQIRPKIIASVMKTISTNKEDNTDDDSEPIEATLINKEADEELSRLLGQSRSRLYFSDIYDLGYEPNNEQFAPPSTSKRPRRQTEISDDELESRPKRKHGSHEHQ